MELRKLKYFIATAEELHFRKAADLVNVTQPALSKQIHELEEEIGVPLFDRTKRKVELTPAGRVFYERARVILDSANKALHEARGVGRGLVGTVRIGFLSTAAMKVLPQALARFRAAIPTAEVDLWELSPEEQMDHLQKGFLDVGILIAEILDEGFEVAELLRTRLVAALPDTPEFRAMSEVSLKDLASYTSIVPARHSRHGFYEMVMEAYQKARVKPERIQVVRMIHTGIQLVGAGLGISLVPEAFNCSQPSGVIFRPLADVHQEIAVVATWRHDNCSPLLREFIRALTSQGCGAPGADNAEASLRR
ncbi:LysR substrate-binding domain-containing protein [Mesoterricola sediminis]|uniref:LysR family transcriptional regulator n=1 Tax=Mesoterricola sediminis TaxID=2927980 RepID=A0AA48KBN9_9BACT|nr:LysR substrate-binding domain-containing protein [Mesoterricola sediminis]BDU76041.1 LysR family transcriptional regulator [Mesoterricola sediminis]